MSIKRKVSVETIMSDESVQCEVCEEVATCEVSNWEEQWSVVRCLPHAMADVAMIIVSEDLYVNPDVEATANALHAALEMVR